MMKMVNEVKMVVMENEIDTIRGAEFIQTINTDNIELIITSYIEYLNVLNKAHTTFYQKGDKTIAIMLGKYKAKLRPLFDDFATVNKFYGKLFHAMYEK